MIYTVEHTTSYRYAAPVFLEPHVFRLRPKSTAAQQLQDFWFEIDPAPAGIAETVDAEGNAEIRCWFNGLSAELTIKASSTVEVSNANPFAYLPLGEDSLPYTYAQDCSPILAPYRAFSGSEEVRRFAERVASETDYQVLTFPPTLTTAIQTTCRQIYQADGPPMEPAHTLWRGEGSCRDLAMVFVESCRAMGLAARFVSGYFAGSAVNDGELHAWAEVFVDGGGWRGFDPTTGLAVANEHIAVAAAARPEDAAPAAGTYRGDSNVVLSTSVCIR